MKNFIIKSNEWYDNLSGNKHAFFFLGIIMGSFAVTEYFFFFKDVNWSIPTWLTIVGGWRTRCFGLF